MSDLSPGEPRRAAGRLAHRARSDRCDGWGVDRAVHAELGARRRPHPTGLRPATLPTRQFAPRGRETQEPLRLGGAGANNLSVLFIRNTFHRAYCLMQAAGARFVCIFRIKRRWSNASDLPDVSKCFRGIAQAGDHQVSLQATVHGVVSIFFSPRAAIPARRSAACTGAASDRGDRMCLARRGLT